MQANSVDSNKVYALPSRSLVGTVASNVLFGAVVGGGLNYAFLPTEEKYFVKAAVKVESKEMYAKSVKNLKTKIETLTKEIEVLTDPVEKDTKSGELLRAQNELKIIKSVGAKDYFMTLAKGGSEFMEKIGTLFNARGTKTLEKDFSLEEVTEFKSLIKKIKLSRALSGAKALAAIFGAFALIMGIAEKMYYKKAVTNSNRNVV